MASLKKVTIKWTDKRTGEVRSAERWQARYRDDADKQRAKNFDRRVDAQRFLDEVTASLVTGRYVSPAAGRVTLQAFYDEWSKDQIWLSNTREGYDHAVKLCSFKDMQLAKIRKSHVQAWVKQMSLDLAPTTIETRMVMVRAVLRAAVDDKLIAEDPAADVVLPRKPKVEAAMKIPTPEVVGSYLRSAEPANRPKSRPGFLAYVALCAFAGLRRGEALGVQVADIDFLGRKLEVRRQLQRAKASDVEAGRNLVSAVGDVKMVIRAPKYESVRSVALCDELIELLAEHIRVHSPGRMTDRWLFADEGRPWNDNLVTYRWNSTRRGLGGHKLHELRHFYASGLIAAGCDVVTVQRALGHATPTTTLNTYAHLWPKAEDRTRAAASGLARQALAGHSTVHVPCTEESTDIRENQHSRHAQDA